MPSMTSLAWQPCIVGAGRTLSAAMSTTSRTLSTTMPHSRSPSGVRSDSTMTTVTALNSADCIAKRTRRSTMGTMAPRRLSTPSTAAGDCGMRVTGVQPRISLTRRMSTP